MELHHLTQLWMVLIPFVFFLIFSRISKWQWIHQYLPQRCWDWELWILIDESRIVFIQSIFFWSPLWYIWGKFFFLFLFLISFGILLVLPQGKKFWRMSPFANFGATWRNLFWRFNEIFKIRRALILANDPFFVDYLAQKG